MHYSVAEVAPAVPAFVEMLPPLLILSGLIFALGCATLIRYFAHAILNGLAEVFSFVPFVGGITAGVIRSLETWITHGLGVGISGIEGAIGHQWHNLARIARFWWNVTVRMAHATWEEAKLLEGLMSGSTLRHLLHDLRQSIHSVRAAATAALHRISHLEHVFTKTIAQGVYPRLRTLEHEVTRTLPREIRSARALAREAEDGVARLWDWTRGIADNPAIAAAIATAIAAIGLPSFEFLRCSAFSKILGRGCGGIWGGLDDLLGLFVDIFLLTNICELIPVLETAVSDVADPLVIALTDIGAGLCSGGIGPAPALKVPALSLPANPGVTLNLP